VNEGKLVDTFTGALPAEDVETFVTKLVQMSGDNNSQEENEVEKAKN